MSDKEIEYTAKEGGTIHYDYKEPNCIKITLRVYIEDELDWLLERLDVSRYRDKIIPAFPGEDK